MMSLRGTSICILAVSLMVGCGSSSSNDASKARIKAMAGGNLKDVVPVSGTVLVDGKPASGVLMQLYSGEGDKPLTKVTAGEDGKYCWTTYTACDGLEPGKYKLTFKHLKRPKKENSEDLFEGRYSDPSNTKYEFTVEAGKPQKDVNYDLSVK